MVQSLAPLSQLLHTLNLSRSLATSFGVIRSQPNLSYFGDFPLQVELLRAADKVKKLTWKTIYSMLITGKDYQALTKQEKQKYYDALIYTALGRFNP